MGHLTLPWALHRRWVGRLETEFFAQGDRERARGDGGGGSGGEAPQISFLMDRRAPGVTQCQLGFLDLVAAPLFGALARAFPRAAPMRAALEANRTIWAREQAAAGEAAAAP